MIISRCYRNHYQINYVREVRTKFEIFFKSSNMMIIHGFVLNSQCRQNFCYITFPWPLKSLFFFHLLVRRSSDLEGIVHCNNFWPAVTESWPCQFELCIACIAYIIVICIFYASSWRIITVNVKLKQEERTNMRSFENILLKALHYQIKIICMLQINKQAKCLTFVDLKKKR